MQIGATELAMMSSSWFVVFALMQFPVGWALDRFGPRRTVLPLMLVGGLGVTLLPMATHVWTGSLAMGLIGMGCSPIYMGALYVFARNHPAAQFGLLASLLIGFGSIGNLAGTMPLAWLAEAYGWRPTLAMLAALYGVAFVLAVLLLRDPPRLARRDGDGVFGGLGLLAAMPIMRLAAPIVFVSYATISAIRGLWVGPFLERVTGLSVLQQGRAVLAMALAMTFSAFAAGWVQSRFGGAKTMTILGNLGVAATLAACSSGSDSASSGSSDSGSSGSVYFLNFKPEAEEAFKKIASTYKEKTGVEVKVVTAASGTYEQTLQSEVAKSNPPTIFNINGPVGLATWQDYALDLSDTDFVKAGQPLVRLDADRAQLSVAQTEAQMRKLENNYRRAQQLVAQQLISAGEVDLDAQFNVDETPYEPHAGTIHVYVPRPPGQ